MTTQTETLKLALEALEGLKSLYGGNGHKLHEINAIHRNHDTAITVIKEALAQPDQRSNEHLEPVAWMTPDREGFRIRFSPPVNDVPLGWDALYTTPPQRKPLPKKQIDEMANDGDFAGNVYEITRAIEAAHGIKE